MTYVEGIGYTAAYLQSKIRYLVKTAIILGTGLADFINCIENPQRIEYTDTPYFFNTAAQNGHSGYFVAGEIGGVPVICMVGRFHYYEGYSFEELAIPIRMLKLMGIERLIITNASGAVNKAFSVGSIVLITDHINLVGASPTRGQTYSNFGNRFFDITELYDPKMRKLASNSAHHLGIDLRGGVYMYFTGPHFETSAEIKAASILGADLVGMSTVPEALAAAQCGIKTLGLSVVTNMATGVLKRKMHDISNIDLTATSALGKLQSLIRVLLPQIESL